MSDTPIYRGIPIEYIEDLGAKPPGSGDSGFPVLPDDHGIRPAGRPDECFYCQRRVGQNHAADCAVIVRDVAYGVWHAIEGHRLGTWKTEEPAHWDDDLGEFHKNESSWCASNMIDDERYSGLPLPQAEREDDCICGLVRFECIERGDEIRRAK